MVWQLVELIETGYRLAADPATDPGTMLLCDMSLLDALTEALAQGPSTPEPRGARTRRRILDAVESVARLGAQSAEVDAATLSRLCAASERLVEQAMREGFALVMPKAKAEALAAQVHAQAAALVGSPPA